MLISNFFYSYANMFYIAVLVFYMIVALHSS